MLISVQSSKAVLGSCFQVDASSCQSSDDRIERIKRQIFDLIEGEEVQDSVPKELPTKKPQQVYGHGIFWTRHSFCGL